jgi:death on curing protein
VIYLDVGDYLAIGEAVLGVPTQELFHASKDGSLSSALMAPRQAFGGVDMYPSLTMKAAVLCSRLVRNHPCPMETSAAPGRQRASSCV